MLMENQIKAKTKVDTFWDYFNLIVSGIIYVFTSRGILNWKCNFDYLFNVNKHKCPTDTNSNIRNVYT